MLLEVLVITHENMLMNLLGRISVIQRTPTQNNDAAKTPAKYD